MTTFIVPANTTIDSDAMFGPLGPGPGGVGSNLEQVFGSVIDTTINGGILGGGLQDILFGGSATNTTINGGEQDVEGGGSANLTTIIAGFQEVFLGGSATNTTINGSTGSQDVMGAVTFTTINVGAQGIEAGGSADQTTLNGGEQEVFPGGLATNTTINGGDQIVFNTASVDITTINAGGLQLISGGGTTFGTTINPGGQQLLELGDNFGGGTPTANGTMINGGTQTITFGTAINTTINSGEQDVGSNGIAENTTIAGGTMHVMAGGVTEGMITFAGLGLLVIDQPVSGQTSFATPLVGVGPHDTFDLTGLPFDSTTGATAGLSISPSGSQQLTVSSGNDSETFTLQNLNPSVTEFLAAPDNNGGTEVTAVDFPIHFAAKLVIAPPHTALIVPNGTTALVAVAPDAGSTVTLANGATNTVVVNGATSATPSALATPLSNAVGDPSNTLNGADSGKDVFVFSGSFGPNTINNFIAKGGGNHDTLELSRAEFGDLATMIKNGNIQQVGNDTLITNPLNPADTIKLTGISALELESHPSNFHFV